MMAGVIREPCIRETLRNAALLSHTSLVCVQIRDAVVVGPLPLSSCHISLRIHREELEGLLKTVAWWDVFPTLQASRWPFTIAKLIVFWWGFFWSSVTIVYLWCVLHYRLLGISTCDKTRSGYLELSKAKGGLSELKAEELLFRVPKTTFRGLRPSHYDEHVIQIQEERI